MHPAVVGTSGHQYRTRRGPHIDTALIAVTGDVVAAALDVGPGRGMPGRRS